VALLLITGTPCDLDCGGKLHAMRRFLLAVLLVTQARAQNSKVATELLEKAKTFGENTRTWRAEVTQTSQVLGPGIKLKSEVRTKVAAQPSLKMNRVNSGDDRTIMVCDGAELFYSGDAHSYYRYGATQQCDLPLIDFYEPSLKHFSESSNNLASISVIGEDHVLLTDGERRCVVVRVELNQGPVHTVRTMWIDPARPVILRDSLEVENQANGVKSSTTTTFTSFELNPNLSPDTFRFTIPPDAIEAQPPK
jgi:outer membrane lipoprotein-sorting protein